MQKYLNIYIFENLRSISLCLQLSNLIIHFITILKFHNKNIYIIKVKKEKCYLDLRKLIFFCEPKM